MHLNTIVWAKASNTTSVMVTSILFAYLNQVHKIAWPYNLSMKLMNFLLKCLVRQIMICYRMHFLLVNLPIIGHNFWQGFNCLTKLKSLENIPNMNT
jgi:hypothetical protein